MSLPEARFVANLLQAVGMDLVPMRGLLPRAADLAIELRHPACDWLSTTIGPPGED